VAALTTAASARSSKCAAAIFIRSPIDRVLADIADARANGARAIFLVDDNITLDVERFETLCRAIEQAGFNDVEYFVQAMTSSIANHGATLAPLMRRAGFRYVFLESKTSLKTIWCFCGRERKMPGANAGILPEMRRLRRSSICIATAWSSSAD
jgi:hypothetical protein